MRRVAGLILIALGAFGLAMAPLFRFYVAERVVAAPLDHYQLTRLEASGASYFDTATLKTRNNVTLLATNIIRGDVRANNGNNDIAVWDTSTNIFDKAAPSKAISIQAQRVAFDRRTAELVNCCGANADGDTSVRMSGYALLFPIAHVEKRDYSFFDMTTKRPIPMRFDTEETVHGLKAYRFVQQVPLTRVEAVKDKLPAKMLGIKGDVPPQKVDRYFEATVTIWVDPRTGIPVKHRQMIHSMVRTPDGVGRLDVARADLVSVDKDQQALVALSDDSAFKIGLVRKTLPVGGLIGGSVLLLLGAATGLIGAARKPAPPAPPRRSDGRFGEAADAPPRAGRH
ncbi:DUF3068 domain-containing protein [Actinomadura macrotermitis]|uniref:DUF3068 domain-containing protein n=1 Tax=Actinomadura macrotermitis TaxID=2585200 RepID=A0A7K0C0T0_9ACTN|nr:DUF3068 domain-containing protein [Actinomadura macrotermitis]MQY07039.1 hypothetical protein [Actinomadura macrotermitis]